MSMYKEVKRANTVSVTLVSETMFVSQDYII